MSNKRWNDDEFEFSGGGPEDNEWMEFAHQMDDDMIVPEEVYYERASEIRMYELGIADKHLRIQLMQKAIRLAKSSFFWYFMSLKSKLRAVQEAYLTLALLVQKVD